MGPRGFTRTVNLPPKSPALWSSSKSRDSDPLREIASKRRGGGVLAVRAVPLGPLLLGRLGLWCVLRAGNQRGGGLSTRQRLLLLVPPGECLCQALSWQLPLRLLSDGNFLTAFSVSGERPSAVGSVSGLDWLGEFCPEVTSVTCSSGVLDQAAVDPRTISCLFICVRLSDAGWTIQPDLGSGTSLKESGCSQGLFVWATG